MELEEIDIEDLVIDDMNIRKEILKDDVDSMVISIKDHGVMMNLIVRTIMVEDKKKYSIICGSRRYMASVKANLIKLPCKIIDVDDITAMGISLTENEGRSPIPIWRTIDWIGQMNQKVKKVGNVRAKRKIIEILSDKSSLTHPTIKKYLKIYELADNVKMLLKEKEERTDDEKEIIKKYIPYDYKKQQLSIGVADLIANNLMHIPEDLLFEHSLALSDFTYDKAKEIIQELMKDPFQSIEDIENSIISKTTTQFRTIKLKKDFLKILEDLSLERRIKLDDLLLNLIRVGLKHY